MYAFFGGAQVFRRALPVTGTLQLMVGLVIEFRLAWVNYGTDTENPVWPNITTAVFLLSYLVLLIRELQVRKAKGEIPETQRLAKKEK
jgi:hypothetical protein